jgi:hypothetical protein
MSWILSTDTLLDQATALPIATGRQSHHEIKNRMPLYAASGFYSAKQD